MAPGHRTGMFLVLCAETSLLIWPGVIETSLLGRFTKPLLKDITYHLIKKIKEKSVARRSGEENIFF
jgi:hypothetical protein